MDQNDMHASDENCTGHKVYKIVEEYISRICISRVTVFLAYLATQYLKSMIIPSIFPLGFARN
jgi:hypothetical protein